MKDEANLLITNNRQFIIVEATDINPIENITVVKLVTKDKLTITSDNITGTAPFIIVDTSAASGNPAKPPTVTISGNGVFNGIIWIIGEAKVSGTVTINGALFVQGNPNNETQLTGTITLNYNAAQVEQAAGKVVDPGQIPQELSVLSWDESL